ncbi:MAG: hypothetical protein VXV96_13825 [Bdellovibrionota bacterium]|nr:hypothetical protein [Bdellovibrionota bacterium]
MIKEQFPYLLLLFSTISMTGIIWHVQLVTYPLFKELHGNSLVELHASYTRKMTFLVLPLMGCELLASLCFTYLKSDWVNIMLLLSVVLLWMITLFISVPLHSKIAQGEEKAINPLIKSNWLRTTIWTIRSFSLLKIISL